MNAQFGIHGVIIETKRLLLRSFDFADLDEFFAYASIEGVGEMAGWRHHKSKEESAAALEKFIEYDNTFAVCEKETGKVIGSLGVEKYGMEDRLKEFSKYSGREIGYVLSKDYWGKGLMTEAVKAVIDYLFHEYKLDFLLCGYFELNYRS